MAFFPRSFVTADPATSFTPLFRLLDDFDQYSRGGNNNNGTGQSHRHLKVFSPKFDVKEVADAYELHGELPGIEQKDIEIEFTDAQTLTVKGHTERSYAQGTPPAGFVEGEASAGAIEGSESRKDTAHQPSVEDEDASKQKESSTEVTTTNSNKGQHVQKHQPQAKFWVSERSVGEFSRSFSFPVRVDQEDVKASMKNGILSIVVPKAKKHESRKITIS